MPKRSTTQNAVVALAAQTQGEADIQAAKAALLATIPNPVFTADIPWDSVVADRTFNYRDDENYRFESNRELYDSLAQNGLQKRGDMMAFSIMPNGKLKILVGHLRHAMMTLHRNNVAAEREKDNVVTDDVNPLPHQLLFGLVYSGLTLEQEHAIAADHTGRKGLNEFELCKEVGEAQHAWGYTIAKLAVHFGIEVNKIRRMCCRYAMPPVMEEYRKEKSKDNNTPYIKIGQKALEALYTAYLADQDAGNGFRQVGPNWQAVWAILQADPKAYNDPKPAKEKGKEPVVREKISAQANGLSTAFPGAGEELGIAADILRWSGNIEDASGNVPNLNVSIQALVDLCQVLRNDNNRLRDEIEPLRARVARQDEQLQGWETDFEAMKAERDELASKLAKPVKV